MEKTIEIPEICMECPFHCRNDIEEGADICAIYVRAFSGEKTWLEKPDWCKAIKVTIEEKGNA